MRRRSCSRIITEMSEPLTTDDAIVAARHNNHPWGPSRLLPPRPWNTVRAAEVLTRLAAMLNAALSTPSRPRSTSIVTPDASTASTCAGGRWTSENARTTSDKVNPR